MASAQLAAAASRRFLSDLSWFVVDSVFPILGWAVESDTAAPAAASAPKPPAFVPRVHGRVKRDLVADAPKGGVDSVAARLCNTMCTRHLQ